MSEKHRNLPPWMVKSDVQRSKDNEAVKKKMRGETTKRLAKKPLRTVVTYWMERELVETALRLLIDDKACAKDAMQAPEEVRIILETDEDTTKGNILKNVLVTLFHAVTANVSRLHLSTFKKDQKMA